MAANTSVRDIVVEEHDRTLQQLESIWDELGLTEDQRLDRRYVFHTHIQNLCERILDDEKSLRTRISDRIMSNTQDIIKLCEELCVTPEDEVDGLTLLELDALLQERIDKLQQTKDERIETLRDLQEKDEGICELLCETPYYIPANLVPTVEDIANVEKHVKAMEKEKEDREKTYATLRAGILGFLEELEQSPNDSFLQKLICSDEEEDVPLGKADLQQLRNVHSDLEFRVKANEARSLELRETIRHLWDLLQVPSDEQLAFLATAPKHTPSNIAQLEEELRRLKVLRQQNMSLFIEKLQEELNQWWEKCFVGETEREEFSSAHTGADEDVLEAYEMEVQKWRNFYNEKGNQEILEMVNHFLNLFVQMLELEEKSKDPSRLFNTRGGALLQEEKAKKKVRVELPRVEGRLIDASKAWEECAGRPFCIFGTPLEEHISSLWEKHEAKRELEKNKKQQEKGQAEPPHCAVLRGVTPCKTPISSTTSKMRGLGAEETVIAKRPKHQATPLGNPSPTKLATNISPKKVMHTPRAIPLGEHNFQLPQGPAPAIIVSKALENKPTEELHSTITYDKFEDKLKSSNECLNSTTLDQASSYVGKS